MVVTLRCQIIVRLITFFGLNLIISTCNKLHNIVSRLQREREREGEREREREREREWLTGIQDTQ